MDRSARLPSSLALLVALASITTNTSGCRPSSAPSVTTPPPTASPVVASTSLQREDSTEPPPTGPSAPRVAQDVAPLPVFPNPDRRERLLDSVPTLTRRIEAFMAADHIPGLAVGLVIDDELAWAQGFGVTDLQTGRPVTPQTAFRIGSVTKTITMTAILRLRDEGKLDLDHPVVEYLPEVGAIGHPTDELQGFTVRQVLTHSSGLPRNGRFDFEGPEHRVDRAEVEASLEGLDLQTVPGLVSSYSNLGYMLLGLLIEDVTGQGYREHIDQAVLAPLGMKASVWSAGDVRTELAMPHDVENGKPKPMHHEDHGAASAGGGLYSTVEDMARFAALQLGAWPPRSGDDSGPLRRSSIREAHSIHFAPHATTRFTPGRYPAAELAGTGLAWSVTRDCELGHVVGHNGRNTGYTGTLALLPQRGVGLVLLSNQHSTNLAELNVHLLEDLAENPALTVRELPVDPRLEPRSRELFAAVVAGDESRLGALLASSWSPEQLQKLWARWRGIHERVGACELDRLGEVTATHATVHGTCERGRVRMELEAHGSGFVDVVPMVALDRPPKHLRKAAANVGKLLARWDEDLAARTFLQRGRPSRYRDFLHGIGQTRGRCTVGRVVEASDVHVEHRLDCEHRSGRLVLTSGEGSTVVDGLWIRDDPEDPRRCVDL